MQKQWTLTAVHVDVQRSSVMHERLQRRASCRIVTRQTNHRQDRDLTIFPECTRDYANGASTAYEPAWWTPCRPSGPYGRESRRYYVLSIHVEATIHTGCNGWVVVLQSDCHSLGHFCIEYVSMLDRKACTLYSPVKRLVWPEKPGDEKFTQTKMFRRHI